MFDKQHTEQDLMFRSILRDGQEDVPTRVWDGITASLDRMERRKTVTLWWRRAAVGMAAVAAAIAIGVVLHHPAEEFELPTETGMVAVVDSPAPAEPITPQTIAESAEQTTYLAYTPAAVRTHSYEEKPAEESATVIAPEQKSEQRPTETPERKPAEKSIQKNTVTSHPANWGEERADKKRAVSLVLSSNTGANSGSRAGGASSRGILKRPVNPSSLQTGITELGDSRFSIPLSFGIGVKIELTEKWSLGTGVSYSFLSRKFDGDFLKIEDGSIAEYTKSEISNQQHYIGIPLNAYYNIISKERMNFYAYAGGAVEKCIANNYSILESKSTHKEKASGVQWSANIGVGVEFMMGKHLGIYLDPSARYYFDCKQPKSIRTSQPLMFGVELGLRTKF